MATSPGLDVQNDDGAGVRGASNRWGVVGFSEEGIGVVGEADRAFPAIYGHAPNGTGVWGAGEGVGVLGAAGERGDGVWGISDGHGVHGTGGGAGVFGESSAGRGVLGRSTDAAGVTGTSQNSNGIVGTTSDGFHAGIVGDGRGVGWGGFLSSLICGDSIFDGNVNVSGTTDLSTVNIGGSLFVFGVLAVLGLKLAVVPHPDGSYRGLYCMESPESWFEDFGRAKVVRGKATVKLDHNFVAVVRSDNYHIFLAPEGDSNGLYVSRKGRGGFEVREQGAGTSTLSFSYRVVARRKDVSVRRFERLKLPVRPKPQSLPKGFPKKPVSIEGLPKVAARTKLPPLPQLPTAPKRGAGRVSRARSRRRE